MKHSRIVIMGLAGLSATLATAVASAGTEKVRFPENYAANFVRYVTVDKPDRNPPIIRFMYINPEALAAAKPGAPLPDGTVIVMEDHKARLGTDGQPVTDANGRFVPTNELTNVFLQEKRAGWGTEYPDDKRNGEWEYAWFEPNGTRKAGKTMDRCFECHLGVSDQDFAFTAAPFIAEIKGH